MEPHIDQYLLSTCLFIIDDLNTSYQNYSKKNLKEIADTKFNEMDIIVRIGHPLVNESRICYFPFLHRPRIPTYSSDLEYNYGLAYQKLPYSPIGYKKEEYNCMFLGNEKDCFHFAIYF